MPSIANWLDAPDWTDFLSLVNRRLSSITVTRGDGTVLAAQNVRLVTLSDHEMPYLGEHGRHGRADTFIVGYKGHDTYPDTDLKFGDRFSSEGKSFDVVEVLAGLDSQFQAIARMRE